MSLYQHVVEGDVTHTWMGPDTYVIPLEPSREHLVAAMNAWDEGKGVTGHYTMALQRYWTRQGPDVSWAKAVADYEFVRRALEVPATPEAASVEEAA